MGDFDSVNLFFEDESRFGLFTRNGKSLTARAVKPVCRFRQVFKSTWLFGAFSPITGAHFELILPHCDSENFQIFLDEMSKEKPKELKILVLDNGAFHKAKELRIPGNIILVFLPPYSPELNPAEKIWARFKRAFTNIYFSKLEDVEDFISEKVNTVPETEIMKTCSFDYIFSDLIWTV
ncbi:MAG: IS630 family transposase [Chitinophagaceae bacterium]